MSDFSSIPLHSWACVLCVGTLLLLAVLGWFSGGFLGTKLASRATGQIRLMQTLASLGWCFAFMGALTLAVSHTLWAYLCVTLFTTFLGITLGLALKEWDGKNPVVASNAVFITTILCLGLVCGAGMSESLRTTKEPVVLQDRIAVVIVACMAAISTINALLVLGLYSGSIKASDILDPPVEKKTDA